MKIKRVSCGHELNLDHWVFDDYEGPVKCFSCGKMMEVNTVKGIAYSINLPLISEAKRNLVSAQRQD